MSLGLPAVAAAQEEGPPGTLTSRGRIMLAGQVSGFWSNDAPALFGNYPTWTLRADPALTYFVRDDLGVGAVLTGGYTRGDRFGGWEVAERELGIAPEFVWNLPLGGGFSLMLRAAFGYVHTWAVVTTVTEPAIGDFVVDASSLRLRQEQSRHYLGVSASLPLIYAVSEAVGLGGGPTLSYDYLVRGMSKSDGPGSTSEPERIHGSRLQVGARVGVYASF
jgi:hypothetical protein